MTPVPDATMDSNGNISIPGTLTTDTSCIGCAGAIDLPSGSDPGARQVPNSFSWIAPQLIESAFRWKLPSADAAGDAAGAIVSDGAATPGTLSIVPFSGSGNIVKATSPVITTPVLTAPVLGNYTVNALPAGSVSGSLAYVTDGAGSEDCTTGGGSNQVLCAYSGSAWAFPGGGGGGGGGGVTLPSVIISTTGPVTDPGGANVFEYNNAGGALTFNLGDGVPGYQRHFRNATGVSGAISINPTVGNTIDFGGSNTSVSLISTGAAADEISLVSDVAHHWYSTRRDDLLSSGRATR